MTYMDESKNFMASYCGIRIEQGLDHVCNEFFVGITQE